MPPAANPNPLAPPGRPAGQTPPQNPVERFEVSGRNVHIQLLPQGDQLTIAGATIEQDAELRQFASAAGAKQLSLLVKGNRLHVADAHTDDTQVTIAGNPGYIEAGGMTLWGGAIHLAKRTNRLWIDGPGRLTMPVTQDLNGQALARSQMLSVDWKRGMNFQSNTSVFEGTVVARSQQQVLNTDKLIAVLTTAVDFSNPGAAVGGTATAGPELEELRTEGPTFLESRQIDEKTGQTSLSHIQLADLSVNRTSGKIAGRGPGWVKHVARGAPPQVVAPGEPAAAPAAAAPVDPDKQFTYLYVTFRQGIDGNINRRRIRLFDHTRTIYGPVGDWNAEPDRNDPAALGPQGMLLEADSLEIREMNPRPGGERGWMELDASGEVFAEGQRFAALGDRLTYVEEKDQFILRGDPFAEIYLENESGGPRNETRVNAVSYWFTRHYITVSGAQKVNLQLPGGTPRRPPGNRQSKQPAVPPGR